MTIARTDLDANQTITGSYDEANRAHQVTIVGGGGLVTQPYDYVSLDSSGVTQDIYTFKSGGAGGTLVATVTIVYTDTSKSTLSTVTKI